MTRATAERVWQCWTDPARVVEWFADRVTGSLEEGGVSWHFDRLGSAMTYRVIAMTPGEHLLLESAEAPGTRLEIVIAPQGDSTMVQIIHSGFTDVPGPDP
ncbi:MAG: SRPBCC domain-containing protein, partial [Gemmatimonadota bacterium]